MNRCLHSCRTVRATFVNDGKMRGSVRRRTVCHCWQRAVMHSAFAAACGKRAATHALGKERRDQRQTDEQKQRNGDGAAHGRCESPRERWRISIAKKCEAEELGHKYCDGPDCDQRREGGPRSWRDLSRGTVTEADCCRGRMEWEGRFAIRRVAVTKGVSLWRIEVAAAG